MTIERGVSMRAWFVGSGLLTAAVVLSAQAAMAQRMGAASSGQVTGVSQNVRAGSGSIARGPGGESAGSTGTGSGSSRSSVVSGKVAGYGARAMTGLSEYVYPGTTRFDSGGGADFPASDFVATMPLPAMPAGDAAGSFGVTLTGTGTVAGIRPARGGVHASAPAHHVIKDPGAITSPFTHTLGGDAGKIGIMPTVLGPAH